NPQPTDWIGLYKENTSLNPPTTPDTSYVDWMNLNSCSKTAGPNPPPSSGSCDFPISNTTPQGTYTVRILRGSSPPYTRLATSPSVFESLSISILNLALYVGDELRVSLSVGGELQVSTQVIAPTTKDWIA